MGQRISSVTFETVNFGGTTRRITPRVVIACVVPACDGKITFAVYEDAKAERKNRKSPWKLTDLLRFQDRMYAKPMIPEGSCSQCGVRVFMTEETQGELLSRIKQHVEQLNTG